MLTIGKLGEAAGVKVPTIRYYEQIGLLPEPERSAGNQRLYPRAVLRRLAVIKVAQRMGLPLAAIADALAALPVGRNPTVADWRRMSTTWRAELDARIQGLMQLRGQLDGCIGCGCLSLKACPLRNPGDRLGDEGPGPHFGSARPSGTG